MDRRNAGATTAVLRPLTGHEEAWLAQHRDVANAIKATRLLTACVLRLDDDEPPPDTARRMLVGDRDYLMLQLRRLTFGDRILAVIVCPACEARMNADFNASAIAIEAGAGATKPAMESRSRERRECRSSHSLSPAHRRRPGSSVGPGCRGRRREAAGTLFSDWRCRAARGESKKRERSRR